MSATSPATIIRHNCLPHSEPQSANFMLFRLSANLSFIKMELHPTRILSHVDKQPIIKPIKDINVPDYDPIPHHQALKVSVRDWLPNKHIHNDSLYPSFSGRQVQTLSHLLWSD